MPGWMNEDNARRKRKPRTRANAGPWSGGGGRPRRPTSSAGNAATDPAVGRPTLSAGNAATDPNTPGNTWTGVGGATDPGTGGGGRPRRPTLTGAAGVTDPYTPGNTWSAVPGSIQDEWAQWWQLQQEWMRNGRVGPAPGSVSGQDPTPAGAHAGYGGSRFGNIAQPQSNWNYNSNW